MRFMLRGRRNGKTSDAIRWLLEDPEHRAIVTHSEVEAERVRKIVLEKTPRIDSTEIVVEYPRPNVYSVGMGLRRFGGNSIEVRIDNLELVLQALFGNVEGAYSTVDLRLGEQFIDTGRRHGVVVKERVGCEHCEHSPHVGRCGAPLFRDVQLFSPMTPRTEIVGTCSCKGEDQ